MPEILLFWNIKCLHKPALKLFAAIIKSMFLNEGHVNHIRKSNSGTCIIFLVGANNKSEIKVHTSFYEFIFSYISQSSKT